MRTVVTLKWLCNRLDAMQSNPVGQQAPLAAVALQQPPVHLPEANTRTPGMPGLRCRCYFW